METKDISIKSVGKIPQSSTFPIYGPDSQTNQQILIRTCKLFCFRYYDFQLNCSRHKYSTFINGSALNLYRPDRNDNEDSSHKYFISQIDVQTVQDQAPCYYRSLGLHLEHFGHGAQGPMCLEIKDQHSGMSFSKEKLR